MVEWSADVNSLKSIRRETRDFILKIFNLLKLGNTSSVTRREMQVYAAPPAQI